MLRQRLTVVQREIRRVLDDNASSPLRVVSMCAGDARDLLGALDAHPRRDVVGRLVEIDPAIAAAARTHAMSLGLADLDVRVGDAGDAAAYADAVPAELVLVCGMLGHISDADVERTVRALPMFIADGATVIWTLSHREPDRTVNLRRWLEEAGFENAAYEPLIGYATVGTAVYRGAPQPLVQDRLFTFIGEDAVKSQSARRGWRRFSMLGRRRNT